MALPLVLAGAYGAYSLYSLYNEGRALRDYKRRYPHVRIRYPSRTRAYKALGSALGAGAMFSGWYSGYLRGPYRPRRMSNSEMNRMYG
jgi:hypothetical protein